MHQNTTSPQIEPSFEENLYSAMKFLHSGLTVRLFSTACLGMSSGYFSSVISQGLRIQNTALMNLLDYLESQRIINEHRPTKLRIIADIKEMVEDEVIERSKLISQISKEGWDRLSASIREESLDEKYGYMDYMPFTWNTYYR